MRLALTNQRYVHAAEPMVKATTLYALKMLVNAGHDVVLVDETNYSKAAREALRDPSWELVWLEVPTDPDTCKERALATNQADLIPVIDEMYKRYEPLEAGETLFAGLSEPSKSIVTIKKPRE